MSDRLAVRAKQSNHGAWIEILVRHASRRERGDAATGDPSHNVPAFERLSFRLNNATVAEVYTSELIADVPLTMIEIDRADNGDTVTVDWSGAKGEFATETVRFDTR